MPAEAAWHDIASRLEAEPVRQLNAILAYERDSVRAQHEALESEDIGQGVSGLSFGIKDNICTLEYPTTCGSRLLDGYRSPFEATAVRRLKDAGGIVSCKTNLDEFGMGSSTEHSAYGRTLHPTDHSRVPGGSSGGSAALVASGAVDAALGSETGGSVRQPAAFCGVVGVKPSYGRVSRFGLVAFGSSLDQIGVLATTVQTAAATLATISGRDSRDATCADLDPLDLEDVPVDFSGLTVGIPVEYYAEELERDVRRACEHTISVMRSEGATIEDVSLPSTRLAVPTYYIIAPAEASSNLARYDGLRCGCRAEGDATRRLSEMLAATRGRGFGSEVKRRIMLGTFVLSAGYQRAYYNKAVVARRRLAAEYSRLFAGGIDLLFTPTTPSTAFKAGEKLSDPVTMYQSDAFVCPANLAGLPAVSLPLGRANGLPVGGQLIGPGFGESKMLSAASLLEQRLDSAQEL